MRTNGNGHFLLMGGAYVAVVLTILTVQGIPYAIVHYLNWGLGVAALCTGSAIIGRAIYSLVRYRPRHPFAFLWVDFKLIFKERAALVLPVILMYPLFIGSFMAFKGAFPLLNDYSWDPAFMRLDRLLHGGLPGQWFVPLMSSPRFSFPVNCVYAAWFLVNGIMLSWMAVSLDFALRRRFWVSFVLCYALLGTAVALLFLSAGPCFYDLAVEGANPYAAQMQALHRADQQISLNSLWLQDEFRTSLDAAGIRIGGASAMPSMHVSSCVLFMLATWQWRRWLGLIFAVFAALTQFACVWMGWHYAVDGYVAAAGTWIIWRVAGGITANPPK